jgi:type IV pilus assembly protein PilN
MRIPINLASEPFRRDRAKLVVTAVCAVALVALLGVQTLLILGERERAAENRGRVTRLNAELAEIRAGQAKADATIQEPANAEVLQRSVLLNTLVARKGISWTRLFADIEQVLPNNVRLIQVRLPQVNIRNEVILDMEVGTADPNQAIEFTSRLAASDLFGPATLLRSDPPSQNEPLYKYRLTVSYAQKL